MGFLPRALATGAASYLQGRETNRRADNATAWKLARWEEEYYAAPELADAYLRHRGEAPGSRRVRRSEVEGWQQRLQMEDAATTRTRGNVLFEQGQTDRNTLLADRAEAKVAPGPLAAYVNKKLGRPDGTPVSMREAEALSAVMGLEDSDEARAYTRELRAFQTTQRGWQEADRERLDKDQAQADTDTAFLGNLLSRLFTPATPGSTGVQLPATAPNQVAGMTQAGPQANPLLSMLFPGMAVQTTPPTPAPLPTSPEVMGMATQAGASPQAALSAIQMAQGMKPKPSILVPYRGQMVDAALLKANGLEPDTDPYSGLVRYTNPLTKREGWAKPGEIDGIILDTMKTLTTVEGTQASTAYTKAKAAALPTELRNDTIRAGATAQGAQTSAAREARLAAGDGDDGTRGGGLPAGLSATNEKKAKSYQVTLDGLWRKKAALLKPVAGENGKAKEARRARIDRLDEQIAGNQQKYVAITGQAYQPPSAAPGSTDAPKPLPSGPGAQSLAARMNGALTPALQTKLQGWAKTALPGAVRRDAARLEQYLSDAALKGAGMGYSGDDLYLFITTATAAHFGAQ